jgi:hypothetical protein
MRLLLQSAITLVLALSPASGWSQASRELKGGARESSSSLGGTSNSSSNQDACKPYRPGESRRFQNLDGPNITGWGGAINYEITAVSAKQFRLKVPVITKGGAAQREKIKKCLAEYAPYLRDRDGTQIEITIDADQPKNIRPSYPPYRLGIAAADERSTPRLFQSEASCEIIVHEFFHFFGLRDHYKEKVGLDSDLKLTDEYQTPSAGPAYFDCRVVPKNRVTVMDNHNLALTKSQPHFTMLGGCVCQKQPCSPIQSKSQLPANNEVVKAGETPQCPSGYKWEPSSIEAHFTSKMIKAREEFMPSTESGQILYYRENLPEPPLQPAQVRHILHPGCDAKNAKLYRCSKFSNVTSGLEANKKCPSLPSECKDDTWLD